MVLDFLAVDNFDFTRKNFKKNSGEKLVKMLGFCKNLIFGQFSKSVLSVRWQKEDKFYFLIQSSHSDDA